MSAHDPESPYYDPTQDPRSVYYQQPRDYVPRPAVRDVTVWEALKPFTDVAKGALGILLFCLVIYGVASLFDGMAKKSDTPVIPAPILVPAKAGETYDIPMAVWKTLDMKYEVLESFSTDGNQEEGIITNAKIDRTGKVSLLKNPEGECYLYIEGYLARATAENYKTVFENSYKVHQCPAAIIFLNSQGGSTYTGHKIGLHARSHYMVTIIPPKGICASACVSIFSGGVGRVLFNHPDLDNDQVQVHMSWYNKKDSKAIQCVGLPTGNAQEDESNLQLVEFDQKLQTRWLNPEASKYISEQSRLVTCHGIFKIPNEKARALGIATELVHLKRKS